MGRSRKHQKQVQSGTTPESTPPANQGTHPTPTPTPTPSDELLTPVDDFVKAKAAYEAAKNKMSGTKYGGAEDCVRAFFFLIDSNDQEAQSLCYRNREHSAAIAKGLAHRHHPIEATMRGIEFCARGIMEDSKDREQIGHDLNQSLLTCLSVTDPGKVPLDRVCRALHDARLTLSPRLATYAYLASPATIAIFVKHKILKDVKSTVETKVEYRKYEDAFQIVLNAFDNDKALIENVSLLPILQNLQPKQLDIRSAVRLLQHPSITNREACLDVFAKRLCDSGDPYNLKLFYKSFPNVQTEAVKAALVKLFQEPKVEDMVDAFLGDKRPNGSTGVPRMFMHPMMMMFPPFYER